MKNTYVIIIFCILIVIAVMYAYYWHAIKEHYKGTSSCTVYVSTNMKTGEKTYKLVC